MNFNNFMVLSLLSEMMIVLYGLRQGKILSCRNPVNIFYINFLASCVKDQRNQNMLCVND
ncbi:MAG: hypothetical protein APR62_09225 [Smithella sp. SDB]|nr:MAG: hypothetical protein APR62_09225 [Smithella sp. SDB]